MNTSALHPALLEALDELARERQALVAEIRRLRDEDDAPPTDGGDA